MAVVVKAVAVIAKAVFAKATVAAVAKFVVTTAASIGISKLLAKRAESKAQATAGGDGGGRVQLPPATDNKLPIVYGKAFVGGAITDAILSTDQKTMWYVVSLAEVPSFGGSLTFPLFDLTSGVYYDGKLVQFASSTSSVVTGLITNDASPGSAQVDTRVNGFLNIYFFRNGRASGQNTGGLTADQILSVANGVPAAQAWTVNHAMTNCAFAIVKVIYSTDAGTTGLGSLTCTVDTGWSTATSTTNLSNPAGAIYDYLLNTRYGCGIPLSRIDTSSINALLAYANESINYTPVGGGSATTYRYRVNFPLDTANDCLTNLQILLDSCDSWLQYSELTGRWRVVINRPYSGTPFLVDSSNLVGGIEVSPIDLNETYNQVEVAYPNTNIKDQTDYQIVDLFTTNPSLISPGEAQNRLNLTLPVNDAVHALYLAKRRLFQSREDLVISFRTDYSGIQIEAGDVIRVTHEAYGWTEKLFRVSEVAEEKDDQGNLFAAIRAFEYSATVYSDDPVQDFVPSPNTGLLDPNVICPPGDPTVATNPDSSGQIQSFDVTSYVPECGLVLYMDFNYGTSSNVLTHQLYRTVQQSNGVPFVNSPDVANAVYTNVSINVNDLVANTYYWSVTARNNTAGRRSGNASAPINWGGANIYPYDPNSNTGGLPGNVYAPNTIPANAIIGANGYLTGISIYEGNSLIQSNAVGIKFVGDGFDVTASGNIANVFLPTSVVVTNYDVPNYGGNIRIPVYANSTSTRNIPLIYPGVSITAGYEYPYVQGTSTTANGYAANSTAAYTPNGAAILYIANSASSYDGWYKLIDVNLSNIQLTTNEVIIAESSFQFISDVGNVDFQIVPFARFSNDSTNNVLQTHYMGFYTTNPYGGLGVSITQASQASNTLIGFGYYVRNMSNGTDLTCLAGSASTQQKIPSSGSVY